MDGFNNSIIESKLFKYLMQNESDHLSDLYEIGQLGADSKIKRKIQILEF